MRTAALFLAVGLAMSGESYPIQHLQLPDQATLDYVLLEPGRKVIADLAIAGRKPGLVVVLGWAGGGRAELEGSLRMWWDGAGDRGYYVVGPVVREGRLFFADGKKDIGPLLDHVRARIAFDPGRVAVAGCSNGGSGALAVAAAYPGVFQAVIGIPGLMQVGVDPVALTKTAVFLRAGGKDDPGWRQGVKQTAEALAKNGCAVDYAEVPASGHVVEIAGAVLLDWLDKTLQAPGSAYPVKTLDLGKDGILEYILLEPSREARERLAAQRRAPGLILGLGWAGGGKAEAEASIAAYWQAAPARGWYVVSPIVRDKRLFFKDGKRDIAPLLAHLATTITFDPARVVVGGASNGGTGALAVAADAPGTFKAVVAIPGSLPAGLSDKALAGFAACPVLLRVGGKDQLGWRQNVERAAKTLTATGARIDYAVAKDDEHFVKLSSDQVLDWLDKALAGPGGKQ